MARAKIDDGADMLGMRRDPRRQQRGEDDDQDDGGADHGGRVAAEAMPVLVGERNANRRREHAHARPPRMRTRGSTKPTSTSIARLATTKKTPEIITTPMTALRSFCRMLRTP